MVFSVFIIRGAVAFTRSSYQTQLLRFSAWGLYYRLYTRAKRESFLFDACVTGCHHRYWWMRCFSQLAQRCSSQFSFFFFALYVFCLEGGVNIRWFFIDSVQRRFILFLALASCSRGERNEIFRFSHLHTLKVFDIHLIRLSIYFYLYPFLLFTPGYPNSFHSYLLLQQFIERALFPCICLTLTPFFGPFEWRRLLFVLFFCWCYF